jgi:hypothetical protein
MAAARKPVSEETIFFHYKDAPTEQPKYQILCIFVSLLRKVRAKPNRIRSLTAVE